MNYAEESLKRHYQWKGKLETVTKMPGATSDDLSLAYTPAWPSPAWRFKRIRPKATS